MQESMKRRALYETFLAKVPCLEKLLPYERYKIADALEPCTFEDGQLIINQGDEGDRFYLIENVRRLA